MSPPSGRLPLLKHPTKGGRLDRSGFAAAAAAAKDANGEEVSASINNSKAIPNETAEEPAPLRLAAALVPRTERVGIFVKIPDYELI